MAGILFRQVLAQRLQNEFIMKVAIPIAEGRISPVFDAAKRLLLVEIEGKCELRRSEEALEQSEFTARARRVADLGAGVLICGAITKPLESMLASEGVKAISRTCGYVDEVIAAFASDRLPQKAFAIPGSYGHSPRSQNGLSGHKEQMM